MAGLEGTVVSCRNVDEWKAHFQHGVESKKLVVVDFTASWCPPCRFISPVLSELAKKFLHVIFLKVDVDEVKPVAEEWHVQAMPTFLFLKDGKLVDELVGADKVTLEKKIATHGAIAST